MRTLWTMPLSVLLVGTVLAQAPMTQAPSRTAMPSGTTGAATQKPSLTDAQIKQSLEQEGFSNVVVQHKGGSHADVTAMKGGRTQRLDVDPTTGKTTAETD